MYRRSVLSGVAALALVATAMPAWSQQVLRLTIASGHPEVFLWVKHLKETFIPAVDAELAKTGEVKIEWTQAYGGTVVKLGSEPEAFQQGLIDVGSMGGVFNPSKWGLLNVTYAMPFGSTDARLVAAAADKALMETEGVIEKLAQETGTVYIGGGFAIDNYQIGSVKPMPKLADYQGVKIGGGGPNLPWLKPSGAVGVQGSFVTFYNDIKTGIYEGYVGFMSGAVPGRMYEVAPYWNEVNLGAMHVGGMGVSKMQWDTFSDNTKAAFKKAAVAYADAYFKEQAEVVEKAKTTYVEGGGKFVEMDAGDRETWIKNLDNPTTEWLASTEARGEPGRKVLEAYRDNLKAAGFTFIRDYLAE